jgi:hypothetical protein
VGGWESKMRTDVTQINLSRHSTFSLGSTSNHSFALKGGLNQIPPCGVFNLIKPVINYAADLGASATIMGFIPKSA